MPREEPGHRKTPPAARLEELLGTLCDGELSRSEARELRDLLEQSDEHRRTYLQTVHLMTGLRKWATSRGDGDVPGLLTLSGEASGGLGGVGASPSATSERRPRRLVHATIGLATAATVAMVVSLGGHSDTDAVARREASGASDASATSSSGPSLFVEDTQEIVARVVSVSDDLRWASDSAPPDFLMRLRPGDLVTIESGVAQVEFTCGAELMIDGACKLQITSPTSARLLHGMLVGRADGDGSFTVVTPSATVVDVGTEFGVRVDENGTDVSVFDGEVHVHGLHATEPASGLVRKLLEGMSVRVDQEGVHRNAVPAAVARLHQGRESLRRNAPSMKPITVSLLDLLAGKRRHDPVVAGSIDPVTGFWGRYEGFRSDDPFSLSIAAGVTQFKATRWTTLIDGVFVPRPEGVATRYNSEGGTIDLPPTTGESWGPIWSRRRLELEARNRVVLEQEGFWGRSAFECASAQLAHASDGLLGMHANAGITFNLPAIRERAAGDSVPMRLTGAIANLDNSQLMDPPRDPSRVDARFYVDGRLRYSRLGFGRSDGEETFDIPLSVGDRFLTIVTTDADNSIHHDHVALIDPRIEPIGSPND